MSTGAEHYQEAERLLLAYHDSLAEFSEERLEAMDADELQAVQAVVATGLAAAQVHATLAQAAATAGEWIWPTGDARAAQEWRPLLKPEIDG